MIERPGFHDRADAGRRLAAALSRYAHRSDVLVLGLPRGGVPVAFEIAVALRAPLDVLVARKLGAPGQPEVAIGAVASGGIRVFNERLISALRLPPARIQAMADAEASEVARREVIFRGGRAFPDVSGKVVILVDDGIATGATLRAGIQALRSRGPAKIVVAVPVAAVEASQEIERIVDDFVCLKTPPDFRAVGLAYEDFDQVSDAEVRDLLARPPAPPPHPPRP